MYVLSLEIFQNLKGGRERKARISCHRQNSNKRLTIVACCAVGQPVLHFEDVLAERNFRVPFDLRRFLDWLREYIFNMCVIFKQNEILVVHFSSSSSSLDCY